MKRCNCARTGYLCDERSSWLTGCEQLKPPTKPPITSIAIVPHNPLPGCVDMNKLRYALDLVNTATKIVLAAITTVKVNPKDGSLRLHEYDRIAALLRHYGVENARIDWNPVTRTIGIS